MEHNSCPFRNAVRTSRGAPRPTCDGVRVNILTPAPGRDNVILIWDSRHMASVTHTYSLTCPIQLALSGFNSVLSPSECVNQSPVSSSCPRLKNACGPLSVSSYSVSLSAELSSSGRRDGECCFQQQGFPTHWSFIRSQHTTDLWPLTFDSFVGVWVCVCVPQGDA